MGRISRDARLAFILMWPHCDDAGRLRASSRALASLLFPFDNDAPERILGWLDELEDEQCIRRYEVEGAHYLEVVNFLKHQKVDHPSKSNIPGPRESSRETDEASRLSFRTKDQGPRIGPRTKEAPTEAAPEILANGKTTIDVSQAFADYNEAAQRTGWTKAQRITPARRKTMGVRLREFGGVDGWRGILKRAEASDFLAGRSPRSNGHAGWTPDVDFFLQPKSLTGIIEGKYDNRLSNETQTPRTLSAELIEAQERARGMSRIDR